MSTVIRWLSDDRHADFRAHYTRSREAQEQNIFDETEEVARNTMLTAKDAVAVNAARLFIDTQKWRLGKMAPKKYGDHQNLDITGTMDISHYMAHDQKIIDRYNAKRAEPITIDNKPTTED